MTEIIFIILFTIAVSYFTIHFTVINIFSIIPMDRNKPKKIVIFDLDETLGTFLEIGIFWSAIQRFFGKQNNESFYEVLDIFPEFLRPNIINILFLLLEEKRKGTCHKVIIYTNNQGPKSWARLIADYFEHKLGDKIFDQIINAYKVNDIQVEKNRTSHVKSLSDFFACTNEDKNCEICFIDDQFHKGMKGPNALYINVMPYKYYLSYHLMAERYYHFYEPLMEKNIFLNAILSITNRHNTRGYEKSQEDYNLDEVISKKIYFYIANFLNKK